MSRPDLYPQSLLVARSVIANISVMVIATVSLLAVAGCQVAPDTQADNHKAASAPYMTLEEFRAALAGKDNLTLVEFCVPAGCVRCDAMRGPIDRLASDWQEQFAVRRINLDRYPQLAWEFNLTVCPSYVAFRGREELFRASCPTSADLIASGLDASLRKDSVEQLSHLAP